MSIVKKVDEFPSNVSDTELIKICINKEFISKCYMNPSLSDVTLIIEGKEFPALRTILSMQSTFFEILFNGHFEEAKSDKIPLQEVKIKPFEVLLRYMYFGDITVDSSETEDYIDILSLAHFFGLYVVVQHMEICLKNFTTTLENFVHYLNTAVLYNLNSWTESLIDYTFLNLSEAIQTDIFVSFNEAALLKLLESDKWNVEEDTILQKVEEWLHINPTTKREELLQKIRLPLIDANVLVNVIRPKKLFTDDQIIAALVEKVNKTYPKCRLVPEEKSIHVPEKNRIQVNRLYSDNYGGLKTRHICQINSASISRVEVNTPQRSYLYIVSLMCKSKSDISFSTKNDISL